MKLLIILITLMSIACPNKIGSQTQPARGEKNSNNIGQQPKKPIGDRTLRAIDFRNFTYDWSPSWEKKSGKIKKITLQNGEMDVSGHKPSDEGLGWVNFGNIKFADIGEDGSEEAIILLIIGSNGNGVSNALLVFSAENGKPKLIWFHETGDGANGGLRNAYVKMGQLVIEQYNQDKVISNGKPINVPNCCPITYTRTYYDWTGKELITKHSEIENNEFDNARVIWEK